MLVIGVAVPVWLGLDEIGGWQQLFVDMPDEMTHLVLPGPIALKPYPDLESPDLAFELLPIGVRGLIMAALIAAIMSSPDSAMNPASAPVMKDFAEPIWNVSEERQVRFGRLVIGAVMVFGALCAPPITGFESLLSSFRTSLSDIIPTSVAVCIPGPFVPWLDGNGAFWTIILGLVFGIPLFIPKQVTRLRALWGLHRRRRLRFRPGGTEPAGPAGVEHATIDDT